MAEAIDPQIIANVWQQAARKVAALRRNDAPGERTSTWNEGIDQAAGILRKEADDVLAMGRMAHLLIVGHIQ